MDESMTRCLALRALLLRLVTLFEQHHKPRRVAHGPALSERIKSIRADIVRADTFKALGKAAIALRLISGEFETYVPRISLALMLPVNECLITIKVLAELQQLHRIPWDELALKMSY